MFLQVHKLDVKGRRVVLNIWVRGLVLAEETTSLTVRIQDTAGDERLRAITSSYYRGTQGIIIGASSPATYNEGPTDSSNRKKVYDVTNRESFDTISWWFAERSKYAPEQAVKMIVGNKSDKVGADPSFRAGVNSP